MPEKLTLTRYLQGRGAVKALTHIEALAFGVPYPLQPGWPRKYGEIEITEAMIEDLRIRIVSAKESTANKARRGLKGVGRAVPTDATSSAHRLELGESHVHLPEAGPHKLNVFHGFVLRKARRYRPRKRVPWA